MTTYTERAYADTTPVEAVAGRAFGWRRALFAFLLTVAAGVVLGGAFLYGLARAYDGRVMPGVEVAGVSLAGLDRTAAEQRLRESLPTLAPGSVTLVAGDVRRTIPYSALGREYDLAAMADQAVAVGRSGTPVERVLEPVRGLLWPTSVTTRVRYDAAALSSVIAAEGNALERDPVSAVTRLAGGGRFAVEPAIDGRTVDETASIEAAARAIEPGAAGDQAIDLQTQAIEPPVTTAEAEAAASRAAAMTSADLRLVAGRRTFAIPAAALRSWLTFSVSSSGEYAPVVDRAKIRAAVAPLGSRIDQGARNAGFITKGLKIVGVRPGAPGLRVDAAATERRVMSALDARASGASPPPVQVAVAASAPQLSTEQATALAPKMRRISSWTTLYPVGEKNFFGKNITVPTTAIDGYLLMPGQSFDFWAVVGEVSRETGYGPGGAILNGRTEPTGALAGGICSCSTTIFNAALRAGLEMGDRRNHYYYINRYPKGLDATVFKSSSGSNQNMTFRNDTPYPILVRGINAYGKVTFQLYSVPTGRSVHLTDPVVRNIRPASDSVEYTDELPKGVRKRVESPVDGFDSWVTRTVRDRSGRVIHQETYYSHYARITGVVEIGR